MKRAASFSLLVAALTACAELTGLMGLNGFAVAIDTYANTEFGDAPTPNISLKKTVDMTNIASTAPKWSPGRRSPVTCRNDGRLRRSALRSGKFGDQDHAAEQRIAREPPKVAKSVSSMGSPGGTHIALPAFAMKRPSSFVESLARCAPLVLAILGLSAAVIVGCGIAEEDDADVSEDDLSCQYGHGYGCYGYGGYGYGYGRHR